MISIPIPPQVLAHLIRGVPVVLRNLDPEADDIELYLAEPPDLTGPVGEAILEVLPFIGEKQ